MSGIPEKPLPPAGEPVAASSSAADPLPTQALNSPTIDSAAPGIPQPSTLNSQPPPQIPDHELIRRIGGGAYGEVWLARNVLGELRAVKVIYRSRFNDARPFEREFEGIQRFEPISRSHPSQLAILHVGKNEAVGCFYYVMELADRVENPNDEIRIPKEIRIPNVEDPAASEGVRTSGLGFPSDFDIRHSGLYIPRTLRHDLDQHGRLPIPDCVQIGLSLTTALAHLHRHGLVHRDIKPSNVIFVSGVPKLGDIGLVTEAGDTQSIVGTEGYIPPEGPGTPQADIFSLGKVLYEISTGLDRRRFAELPEDLRSWPDRNAVVEFNEILLKACARHVEDRYATAEALSSDLKGLAAGGSVLRARRVARRWRLAKRSAVLISGATAIAALIGLAWFSARGRASSPVERSSTNETANTYCNLGKVHFDLFRATNMAIAADCFKRAIAADTNFAPAYAHLAATYFWCDPPWNEFWKLLPQAETVARQALALDSTLAEPHLALGWFYGMHEWNWAGAEKHDKLAVAFNGSSSFCRLCHAELLRMAGRLGEALEEIKEAKRLDPNSRIINARLVHYLLCMRRFDEALAQQDRVEAMENGRANWGMRREIYMASGDFKNAIEANAKLRLAEGAPAVDVERELKDMLQAPARELRTVLWRKFLEASVREEDLYGQARCQAQLGQTKLAIELLEKVMASHDNGFTFSVMTDWALDPLRSEPRFKAILRTMNFR